MFTEATAGMTSECFSPSLTVTSHVKTPVLDMFAEEETSKMVEFSPGIADISAALFHCMVTAVPSGVPDTLHVSTATSPTATTADFPTTDGLGTVIKIQVLMTLTKLTYL